TPEQVRDVRPVGHQACGIDVFPSPEHGRQPQAERQDADAIAVGVDQRIGAHVKRLRPAGEPLEGRRNILRAPNFEFVDFDTQRFGRGLNLAHLIHSPRVADIAQHGQAARPGMTSLRSVSRLDAVSLDISDRPVTLPPGRAKLVMMPSVIGSIASANTIGIVDVACMAAGMAPLPVTITSTLSRTNSVATST